MWIGTKDHCDGNEVFEQPRDHCRGVVQIPSRDTQKLVINVGSLWLQIKRNGMDIVGHRVREELKCISCTCQTICRTLFVLLLTDFHTAAEWMDGCCVQARPTPPSPVGFHKNFQTSYHESRFNFIQKCLVYLSSNFKLNLKFFYLEGLKI